MERQLPQLEQSQQHQGSWSLTLFVPANLRYFEGHFEHFPILPGVSQLDWVLHYAQLMYQQRLELVGMEAIKYQSPVPPNTRLTLEFSLDAATNKLSFCYFDSTKTYSRGKVKLR
ncbi:ApeI family dehydratase [Vibrio sp. 10N]|uniref:ApeI family dehydratase n=1 Tax=Vibrio sp. 10N TaxID=3058938 RepID=UPI002813A418|nr:3-hydroxyacyl-ACP dehydratase [Vibrio sp. 10N]